MITNKTLILAKKSLVQYFTCVMRNSSYKDAKFFHLPKDIMRNNARAVVFGMRDIQFATRSGSSLLI